MYLQSLITANYDTCSKGYNSFELITGYVFSSPSETLATIPGTLQLTDCLNRCRNNSECQSINFETGLCIMFSASAIQRPTALNPSQFPVFTIYAQKLCFSSRIMTSCNRAWIFERVNSYELRGFTKKKLKVVSKIECMERCLFETEFECRSVNYFNETNECNISDMDRHTITSTANYDKFFTPSQSVEYLENNCIQEPIRLCDFKAIKGRVLKTVDSVYQDIKTVDECRKKCLNSQYRCYSFDLGDPSNKVCRTTHLDTGSLSHINEPYFEIPDAVTYELNSCYNGNDYCMTILCRSREMIAKIKTNRIFNGKVYSKTKPNSCVNDVSNSLQFEIAMAYNEINCDVQQNASNKYIGDIVIQHHDMIVTTRDLGLSLVCTYDLTNKTISNSIYLEDGDIIKAEDDKIHSATVSSPNVSIIILDRTANPVQEAQVGDLLTLRFQIFDDDSPFDIFIRELAAVDGSDSSEIILIDSNGCPTDVAIMGPIMKVKGSGKKLETSFEAFKFPTSNIVQFRAIVTPCLGSCPAVHCFSEGSDGQKKESYSFGRRKKRSNALSKLKDEADNEMVVVQSITIKDGFDFQGERRQTYYNTSSNSQMKEEFVTDSCLDMNSVTLICGLMLAAQTAILLLWAYLKHCQHMKSNNSKGQQFASEYSYPSSTASQSEGRTVYSLQNK
ncbi:uncharacterized protein B4U80_09649 [Leptotrombidium deliense]|uniref:Uncharacterized protein n=1 Tax=Leptotrombidium deliense TaxID=299467 RepID=A0A443SI69_9ACAR|nr:uncharacterized protein B4U80_09649 [Leptotrombidium deliense]